MAGRRFDRVRSMQFPRPLKSASLGLTASNSHVSLLEWGLRRQSGPDALDLTLLRQSRYRGQSRLQSLKMKGRPRRVGNQAGEPNVPKRALPRELCLAKSSPNRYRVNHPENDPEGRDVVFSGQILAQSIMASDDTMSS